MQRGEGGSHSIGMDTNMPGFFPLPFTLGEAMDNYVYAPVANSDEFWRMRGIRDFTPGTPYTQISSTQAPDHIMDAIPLPGTFAYPVPSEYPKNAITDNSSNPSDSLFNHCFEGLPFTTTGSNRSDQCSEISSSDPIGYALHRRQSEHVSSSSSNLSLSFDSRHNPLHLSSLLSGSRFFHAMEEILAEIACYALENFDGKFYSSTGINNNNEGVGETHGDQKILLVEAKKKNLLALLQMVDERYNQCLDEIHTVISAFYAVTELDPNLHARFALPTISFMYKNLRERISSHILAMGSHLSGGDDASRGEDNTLESCFLQNQWALQQLRKRSDHQLWRPQRGLPERSVSVLRAWMFQNFLHPYPKDAEKHLLALRSGLTRNQVSNWFINARVRLWKPMIEEMYSEMNRRKVRRNDEEDDMHVRNHLRFENARFTMD